MDYNDLATFVGAAGADDYVQQCWDEAIALVDGFIGDNAVPSAVVDRCYLECGAELYHRKNAPNGIAQYNEFNGAPVRIARDPMTGVYSLLGQHMVIGI